VFVSPAKVPQRFFASDASVFFVRDQADVEGPETALPRIKRLAKSPDAVTKSEAAFVHRHYTISSEVQRFFHVHLAKPFSRVSLANPSFVGRAAFDHIASPGHVPTWPSPLPGFSVRLCQRRRNR
jgi:hypothetical protein